MFYEERKEGVRQKSQLPPPALPARRKPLESRDVRSSDRPVPPQSPCWQLLGSDELPHPGRGNAQLSRRLGRRTPALSHPVPVESDSKSFPALSRFFGPKTG